MPPGRSPVFGPTDAKPRDHSQSHSQSPKIIDVATFAHTHTGMERDRALHDPFSDRQRNVEEMRVELQVDSGIQNRHQALEAVWPEDLIGCPDVRERPGAEMLELE